MLTSIAIIGGAVSIAVVVALTPRSESAKAANPNRTDTSTKDITLPDNVRDAPENNAELHPAPRLGPPAKATGLRSAENSAAREAAARRCVKSAPRRWRPRFSSSSKTRPPPTRARSPLLAHLTAGPNPALPAARPPTRASPAPGAGGGLSAGGIADPNMQQHKNDFLSRDGINNASYLSQSLASPRSPYEVKAGTIIPTSLITGMNSDLPGQIVGQVRENVYDTVSGNYLLIPQGSRLLATYDSSVTFGQERVLVCWNRLIRPDGSLHRSRMHARRRSRRLRRLRRRGGQPLVANHHRRRLGHARVRDRPAQPGRRLWLQPDGPTALGRKRRRRSQSGRPERSRRRTSRSSRPSRSGLASA